MDWVVNVGDIFDSSWTNNVDHAAAMVFLQCLCPLINYTFPAGEIRVSSATWIAASALLFNFIPTVIGTNRASSSFQAKRCNETDSKSRFNTLALESSSLRTHRP